ncbi:MAG TPA: VOC family protein, partial [Candidatus Woesebacteria bacterium]|nr:VOC family protein [Candidatus Woesebacteria bacterium]
MSSGIHHITAIASNGQNAVHFYSKILGLRLVKKTVNQDDTSTYHLFFGDKLGHPGMDLTFFIFQPPMQGKRGNGLVTTISLAVPESSLEFWLKRFAEYKVRHQSIEERFGKKRILFYDEDNQQLELVAVPQNELDSAHVWHKEINKENVIHNFYSATLSVHSKSLVEPILTQVFGYKKTAEKTHVIKYTLQNEHRASVLEIEENPKMEFGFNAAGTVHHIAFRAKDEKHQLELRQKVHDLGIQTTDVIDRFYFKSVYFRVPAGILFEIATD